MKLGIIGAGVIVSQVLPGGCFPANEVTLP